MKTLGLSCATHWKQSGYYFLDVVGQRSVNRPQDDGISASTTHVFGARVSYGNFQSPVRQPIVLCYSRPFHGSRLHPCSEVPCIGLPLQVCRRLFIALGLCRHMEYMRRSMNYQSLGNGWSRLVASSTKALRSSFCQFQGQYYGEGHGARFIRFCPYLQNVEL